MLAGCALTPADRYSTKMASEGASGEQLPPVQTLVTAVLGSVDAVSDTRRVYKRATDDSVVSPLSACVAFAQKCGQK